MYSCVDRWSSYWCESVARQGVVPLDLIRMVDHWSCYQYESVVRRNSAKGLFSLTWLKWWIIDPVIGPSQWLAVTREEVILLDLIRLMDHWSCYRSESVGRRNLPRGCSRWLDLIRLVDHWSCYRYESVARRISPRVSTWDDNNGGSLILLSIRVSGLS